MSTQLSEAWTPTRYAEVDQELAHVESFLAELAQEIRQSTTPTERHNHTWLQVDNALGYVRSLREALRHTEQAQQ